MALVTTFMTTPLLHLVERFFVHREEKLSLKRKLIFCFGRPESGRSLLSIYDLLFGKQFEERTCDCSALYSGYGFESVWMHSIMKAKALLYLIKELSN